MLAEGARVRVSLGAAGDLAGVRLLYSGTGKGGVRDPAEDPHTLLGRARTPDIPGLGQNPGYSQTRPEPSTIPN